MTCHELRNLLPDFLDEALEDRLREQARAHLEKCPACREALQRERIMGRILCAALDRKAAEVSVSPAFSQQIRRAARSQFVARPAARGAWSWCTAHPLRVFGAAAVLLGLMMLCLPLVRSRLAALRASTSLAADTDGYSIDVPFSIETHVFKIENGTMTDAVVSRVATAHAHFSAPPSRSRLSP